MKTSFQRSWVIKKQSIGRSETLVIWQDYFMILEGDGDKQKKPSFQSVFIGIQSLMKTSFQRSLVIKKQSIGRSETLVIWQNYFMILEGVEDKQKKPSFQSVFIGIQSLMKTSFQRSFCQ